MNIKSMFFTMLFFSFFVVGLNGCNNTMTYYEKDVYIKNKIKYDKRSKKPITAWVRQVDVV